MDEKGQAAGGTMTKRRLQISILCLTLLVSACAKQPYPRADRFVGATPTRTTQAESFTALRAPVQQVALVGNETGTNGLRTRSNFGREVSAAVAWSRSASQPQTASSKTVAKVMPSEAANPPAGLNTAAAKPATVAPTTVALSTPATAAPETAVRDAVAAVAPAAGPGHTTNLAIVQPTDIIEVRFYRNTMLESERYSIGVGDVLRLDIVDHIDISRERVLVLPDGQISLPLVGSIRAAGRNVDDLSDELVVRYESEEILDPRVTIAVIESDKRLDTLLGQQGGGDQAAFNISVSEAGILSLPFIEPIPTGQTMPELVTQIRDAYRQEFGGRLEVTANLVQQSSAFIYVMGEVTTPAPIAYTAALNPVQAVAAAGGFLPTAEPEDVRVIRFGRDGSYNLWAFDLESELGGGGRDAGSFALLPQDVVYIRPSGIANANRWIEQYIVNMIPFSLSAGVSFQPFDNGDN